MADYDQVSASKSAVVMEVLGAEFWGAAGVLGVVMTVERVRTEELTLGVCLRWATANIVFSGDRTRT